MGNLVLTLKKSTENLKLQLDDKKIYLKVRDHLSGNKQRVTVVVKCDKEVKIKRMRENERII